MDKNSQIVGIVRSKSGSRYVLSGFDNSIIVIATRIEKE